MTQPGTDAYATLGVAPDASDAELRAAYRRLVLRHHPDHNNGSAESARRFEQVQEAYAQVLAARRAGATGQTTAGASPPRASARTASPPRPADPAVDARIAAMERELYQARLAQQRAREEAMRAAATDSPRRPTPEELGYITTDDSLGKIFDDATEELADRWSKSREQPLSKRLTDLFRGRG